MKTPQSLVFGSTNKGKLKEVQAVLGTFGIEAVSPSALGTAPEVEEAANSYEGNAELKAQALHRWSKRATLADDTGLEVFALGGAPGVRSARFAGESASMADNVTKLLSLLRDIPPGKRQARFVCVLVLVLENGESITVRDELEGSIALEPRGSGGFGYDPIFIVGDTGKTLAELKEEAGFVETHRTKALRKLVQLL